jgi:hypothetical protein
MSMESGYSPIRFVSLFNDFLLAMEPGLKENRVIGGEILNNQWKNGGDIEVCLGTLPAS